MDIFRMMGIIIVFGAPAIIVGGLAFHLFHSWFAVALVEAALVLTAVTTAYKAAGKSAGQAPLEKSA